MRGRAGGIGRIWKHAAVDCRAKAGSSATRLTDGFAQEKRAVAAKQRNEIPMMNNEKPDRDQLLLLEEKSPYGADRSPRANPRPIAKPVSASGRRDRKSIQDVLLPEGLAAVKLAVGLNKAEELQNKLEHELGQNSAETRRRYAQSILLWFFWDGIDGLARQTWQAYQDEQIETSILRYMYLAAEPLVGNCVAQCLFPLEDGMLIPPTYFERYLRDALGEEPPPKTLKRLKMNLAKLGFLDRSSAQGDRLNRINVDKTAFLCVFHSIFAPAGARTVELTHILKNPFWKYMGIKSEHAVRLILREADASSLFGKYVVADQLEQVTTCFSLSELLNRKVKL